MVAIIKAGKTMRNILHYNENKVATNQASLIHSVNFAKDTDQLLSKDKIGMFEKLTTLNQRTSLNAIHISLNFDPSDKLSTEKLSNIAEQYMQEIGFGAQPFLVYQHFDSGHPHIHIVSTNIKADGKRISLHNIGRLPLKTRGKKLKKNII